MTGEILAEAGETLTREKAGQIERAGVADAYIAIHDEPVKIMSNGMVDIADFVNFDCDGIRHQ